MKYDVDADREMAMNFKVEAMPTFIAIHDGQEVGRVRGASRDKVEELIQKLLLDERNTDCELHVISQSMKL